MPSEIAIPFTVDKTGSISTVSDPVARGQQHLTTFVLTTPRERVMRPDFGSPIMRQVFEPISTMGTNILASDLTAAVSEYVKDVILNNITIDPAPTGNPQDGTLGISLAFSLADAGLANTGTTQTEVNMMIGAQQ